jgi:hypothetical protein
MANSVPQIIMEEDFMVNIMEEDFMVNIMEEVHQQI